MKTKGLILSCVMGSFLTYGCAGGNGSERSKGPAGSDEVPHAEPLEINLSAMADEQCLNAARLFSFIEQNRDRMAVRVASVGFGYDSQYRVRRNFILRLAGGEFTFSSDPNEILSDFSDLKQESCEEVSMTNSIGETEPATVNDSSPEVIEFTKELAEESIAYRIEILSPESFKVSYQTKVMDYTQCPGGTEVLLTRERIVRLAQSPQHFPQSETIDAGFLKLLLDIPGDQLPELRSLVESTPNGVVELAAEDYERIKNRRIDGVRLGQCDPVPEGGTSPLPTPPTEELPEPPEEGDDTEPAPPPVDDSVDGEAPPLPDGPVEGGEESPPAEDEGGEIIPPVDPVEEGGGGDEAELNAEGL